MQITELQIEKKTPPFLPKSKYWVRKFLWQRNTQKLITRWALLNAIIINKNMQNKLVVMFYNHSKVKWTYESPSYYCDLISQFLHATLHYYLDEWGLDFITLSVSTNRSTLVVGEATIFLPSTKKIINSWMLLELSTFPNYVFSKIFNKCYVHYKISRYILCH